MTQQESQPHGMRCLLCTNRVQHQGDVCPQCEPRYLALGKVLIEYANQLESKLKASSHKHSGAPMRFAPDVHFFLKELDMPVPYEEGKVTITHCLTVMAAAIHSSFSTTTMGFPEEPGYFVPIATWKLVSHTQGQPGKDDGKRGGSDGQL